MNNNKINNIIYSLKLNYKSWIFFIFSIYFLSNSFFIGFINFIVFFLFSYFVHYLTHFITYKNENSFLSFFNRIHHYHHTKDNIFAYITEILAEFVSLTCFIFIKIFIQFICDNKSFDFIIKYINIPISIFVFIVYLTIHYINYGIFHVNKLHEYHHKNIYTNIGPDICDIIFDTKYKDDFIIEKTDHYIYNIFGSFIIIFLFLKMYNSKNNENNFKYFFIILYVISILLLLIFTTCLFIKDIKKNLKKDYKKFREL